MIIETIFNLIRNVIFIILSIIPDIPQTPASFQETIDVVLTSIFEYGAPIISVFIRIETIKIIVPILIVIVTFPFAYKIAMWVIRKIPLSID